MKARSGESPPDEATTREPGDALERVARLLRGILADAVRDALLEVKKEITSSIATEAHTGGNERSPDRLLTAIDVAAQLNVRPSTVREWIRTGYLPAVQVGPGGRRYGIRPTDLEAALKKRASETKTMDSAELAIQIVKSTRKRARGRKE